MIEPPQLRSAREHLARAEAMYRTAAGLAHLEEGLALLQEVLTGDAAGDRLVARNLACTYATKIYGCVQQLVERDRGLPEPDLEHLFKLILAFDQIGFDLPAEARSTKIKLVRRLIHRYYEGHSPTEKRKALEQLTEISGGDEPAPGRSPQQTQRRRR